MKRNYSYGSYRWNLDFFKMQLTLILVVHKLLLILIQYSHFLQG